MVGEGLPHLASLSLQLEVDGEKGRRGQKHRHGHATEKA
jgi:hypothetical protein